MKHKKLTIGYKRAKTPNRFLSLNLLFKNGSRLIKIKIPVKDCNLFEKFSGLMFSQKEKAKILLFSFKKKQKIAIHSFFVFYPLIAVWLGKENNVVEVKIVKPFEPYVSPRKTAFKLIEIPINKKNKKFLKFFGISVVKNRNI